MNRATLLLIFATAMVSLSLLSGCGQSGPLYIPGNPSTMAVPPSQTGEDDSEDAENKEESEQPE
ncbi:MAG: lipoprotein [Gammaproteobacteria bacterium]|nr:lipoprotein [Gammaproteobacteria bacterium]